MSRMSIGQFRAALVDRANEGAAMRAYRRLARQTPTAAAMLGHEWPTWPPVAARTAQGPGDWIVWTAAPAA